MKSADAIVFVADARFHVMDENRRCLALTRRYLRERDEWVPIVVQANKQDAEGAVTPAELAAALRMPKLSPVVSGSAHRGAGVRECFNLAVRSAVRATQTRIHDDGLDALAGTPDTADDLLDAMLVLEEQDLGEDEPTEDELTAS